MGVYSNTEIRDAIKKGVIVSIPFNERHVSEASLDFTLGHYYFRQDRESTSDIYNPFDQDDVNRFFQGPIEAISNKEWCEAHGHRTFVNIPDNHPIIVLEPGERIIAHTHEFIGIRAEGGACEVRARSSWARNGLAICYDAGWIDPGYINRITLQICNLNKFERMVIPVGERIGQLIFHHTGPVEGTYAGSRGGMSGKYVQSDNLNETIANWKPSHMLPRAFRDERKLPETIKSLKKGTK